MKHQNSKFALKLEVGDITLLEFTFDGIVCFPNFLEPPNDAVLEEALPLLDKHEVEAVKIISLPIGRKLEIVRFRKSALIYRMSKYNHHYIDAQTTFQRYQEKFSSRTRSTLKRKLNKFITSQSENNCFKKFVTPDEISRFIELAAPISAKTYQSRLFGRGLPLDDTFRQNMRKQASLGRVRGYLLYYAGCPVAYTFGPLTEEGVFLFDYNGYDPDYSKLSPGNVLQYKIVEDLCEDDNVKIYDLCIGESEHKSLFSTGSTKCVDVLILRMSAVNVLIVVSHLVVTLVSRLAGVLLASLNLKNRIKKLVRMNSNVSVNSAGMSNES